MKDFYYILGLDVNCTASDIREAYRKLSKKFHPDLNQQDNYFENRFKEIRQAYETLIDPAGRAAYDSLIKKDKAFPVKSEPKKQRFAATTKSIDIAFTIMLVVLTVIFGDYVIKSITGSKPSKPANIAVAEVDEKENTPVIKHHKKKHHLSEITADKPIVRAPMTVQDQPVAKPIVNVASPIVPSTQPVIKPQPKPMALVAAPVVQQSAPVFKSTKSNNMVMDDNILTGAYIKSNATGMVYMRAEDNYNADIVSRIPGNSRIAILEKGDSFYKIEYHNQTGYVPKWTVKTD